MRKLLLQLISSIVIFASCTNNSTTDIADMQKIKAGDNVVYYKDDDIDKADAKKLANYLAKSQFLGDMAQLTEITKNNGNYELRVAVDKDKIDDKSKLLLWKYQYELAENVFDKQKVKIILADKNFKDIETLGPIARVKVEDKNVIYYNSKDFTKDQAEKLADFFVKDEYFSGDNEKDVFLTMQDNVPVVRFIINKKVIMDDEAKYVPLFSYIMEQMRNDVFDKDKAKVILTSVNYEDVKTVPPLTDEERKKVENQFNTTDNNKNQNTQNIVDSVSAETTSSGVIRFKNN